MTATNLTWTLLEGRTWTLSAIPLIPSIYRPQIPPYPHPVGGHFGLVSLLPRVKNTLMYYASSAVLASRSHRAVRSRIHWLNRRSINSYQR